MISMEDGVRRRVACVGAIVVDDDGRLLLIQRAHEPGAGMWSVPGGRVEAGEDDATAVVREVREETGLEVAVGRHVGTVERAGPDGVVFVINDYLCSPTGGSLEAGDDAADALWATTETVQSLPTVPLLLETLQAWRVLP
jgi:ADP-ribose pyrophosphatase YjhB (NUDIX family)